WQTRPFPNQPRPTFGVDIACRAGHLSTGTRQRSLRTCDWSSMAVKLWKNTKTLDGLIDESSITDSPEDADVALLGSKGIDLDAFPKLRGIFRAGVGRENVPEAAASARGIKVA